jgi:molybdopterin converting factor small subunit
MIAVKFFGLLRGRAGTAAVDVAADEMTVLDLLALTQEMTGHAFLDELLDLDRGLLAGTIILINGENIRLKQGLQTHARAGDTVALFSPAGGG